MFAAELKESNLQTKEGQDEQFPKQYLLTPTGAKCNRALVKGACGEHGKVEGVDDLRIKAVLDDGEKVQDILMNREITEAFTGITLDKAKEMATEALDQGVVLDVIKNKLVGRYYVVAGKKLDRFILVDSIKLDVKPIEEDIARILAATATPVAMEA